MIKEENIITGAIQSPKDERDYSYAGMATIPFDWEKGFDIEEVIGKKLDNKDQGNSGSCGGQAVGYFGQALDPDKAQKSAKFIYSQCFVLPAGTYGRDLCKIVKEKGWGDEELTVSYENGNPPTEAFMQKKGDITSEAYTKALTDKALSYVSVSINIDTIAEKIRDNKGVILGVSGQNNGTWLSKFPLPPTSTDVWRHWLYFGKAKMIDGKKYLGFANSWGESVGENGWQWIGEDYIKSPHIFEAWTLDYDFQKTTKYIFTKTLRYGSRGDEVKELQKKLNTILGINLIVDGKFGTKTKIAVINYQLSNGLVPDGVAGQKTNKKLNE